MQGCQQATSKKCQPVPKMSDFCSNKKVYAFLFWIRSEAKKSAFRMKSAEAGKPVSWVKSIFDEWQIVKDCAFWPSICGQIKIKSSPNVTRYKVASWRRLKSANQCQKWVIFAQVKKFIRSFPNGTGRRAANWWRLKSCKSMPKMRYFYSKNCKLKILRIPSSKSALRWKRVHLVRKLCKLAINAFLTVIPTTDV